MITATALRTGARVVTFLACSAHFFFAQQSTPPAAQPPEAQNLIFKSVVNRVILDVVVTDSKEKPVRGLTQQDFAVAEDGQAQQILSFDVHDFDSPPEALPKLPPLPPNTFVNVPTAPERGPLYVLLLDLVNMEMNDQITARQQLLKFVREKPAGTRFAVMVLSDSLRLVQGFTEDRDVLFAAVDPQKPKAHIPRIFLYSRNYGRGDSLMMVSIFTFIAHYLDGLPGRKNLIWFAGNFPMSLDVRQEDSPDVREQIKQAIDTMAHSQVAVYPVDVRGVAVDDPRAGLASSAGSTAGAGGSTLAVDYLTEGDIATATGGHAFYSTNDLKGALAEATEAGGNYYTLTYAPSNRNYDGKLRKMQVELAKQGYHLAYRRSYYADSSNSPLHEVPASALQQSPDTSPAGDSLSAYMRPGAPVAHQVFFRAHIHTLGAPAMATAAQMSNLEDQPAYFRARRKNRPAKPLPPIRLQPYAIDYTLAAGSTKPGTAGHSLRPPILEVAVAAFDDEGRMLNGLVQNSDTGVAAGGQSPQGIYRVQQRFDVPINATAIRLAVRDISTDRIGAIEIPLPLAPETQAQSTAPAQPRSADSAPTKPN